VAAVLGELLATRKDLSLQLVPQRRSANTPSHELDIAANRRRAPLGELPKQPVPLQPLRAWRIATIAA